VRFEHADFLMADLLPLTRRLGVVVVPNPPHFAFPEARMRATFGTDPAQVTPLRSLLAAGIPVAIGSDGPMNPFLGVMFASTHPANPREAVTREQAVAAYTRGSAYAEFAERDKGTLAPGMLADLAVLSHDIFTVPPAALPGTTSVLTLVGGRVVFDAGAVRAETAGAARFAPALPHAEHRSSRPNADQGRGDAVRRRRPANRDRRVGNLTSCPRPATDHGGGAARRPLPSP
jgi:imidazolonepropionase-like amidohydrolase